MRSKLILISACSVLCHANSSSAEQVSSTVEHFSAIDILVKYSNNSEGIPALHYAVKINDERAVELLLEYGADPNSLLHPLKLLHSANYGSGDHWELTNEDRPFFPLDYAARSGHIKIIQLLIDYGAEVNHYKLGKREEFWCGDKEVFRPFSSLYFAAQANHEEAVRVLVVNGAKMEPPPILQSGYISSYQPLAVASQNENIHIFRALLDDGTKIGPLVSGHPYLLHSAASFGSVEIVQFLLENGVYVDTHQGDYTPLMQAKGLCVELLLNAGANPKAKDTQGRDALYFAASRCDIYATKSLLKQGVNINLLRQNEYPGNPFQIACEQ